MLNRTVLVAFALVLIGGGALAIAKARPTPGAPLPGLWRYETAFLFSSDSKEKCIGPEEISKMLEGPSNRHYDCVYPVRQVGGGKARFEGTCTNKKHGQTAKVSLSGAYSPERFDLKGVVHADLGGLSLPVNASVSATRLSPTCPAA